MITKATLQKISYIAFSSLIDTIIILYYMYSNPTAIASFLRAHHSFRPHTRDAIAFDILLPCLVREAALVFARVFFMLVFAFSLPTIEMLYHIPSYIAAIC